MKRFTYEELASNYSALVVMRQALDECDCQVPELFMRDFRTGKVDSDTIDGWIERLAEFLQDVQRRCIFRAVCRHCRPRGAYGNLMRFARYFADEAVREICPSDLGYEIGMFYTKNRCPFVVEFEL